MESLGKSNRRMLLKQDTEGNVTPSMVSVMTLGVYWLTQYQLSLVHVYPFYFPRLLIICLAFLSLGTAGGFRNRVIQYYHEKRWTLSVLRNRQKGLEARLEATGTLHFQLKTGPKDYQEPLPDERKALSNDLSMSNPHHLH